MAKQIFSTQKEKDHAVALFRELRENRGWQLYVKVLESYIDNLTQRLLLGEEKTIEEVNRIRDSISVHKIDKDVPEKIIKMYTEASIDEANPDPYFGSEDFTKKP